MLELFTAIIHADLAQLFVGALGLLAVYSMATGTDEPSVTDHDAEYEAAPWNPNSVNYGKL